MNHYVVENDLGWYYENCQEETVESVFYNLRFTEIYTNNSNRFCRFNEENSYLNNLSFQDNLIDKIDKKKYIEKILFKIPKYYRKILYSLYAIPENNFAPEILSTFNTLSGPASASKLIKSTSQLIKICKNNNTDQISLIKLKAQQDKDKSISLYIKYKNEI